MHRPIMLAMVALLAACSVMNSRAVYEGVRATQRARSTGAEPQGRDLPPYDEYQHEREKAER